MDIKGKRALINKLVYEVKYHQGYLFLDRCGLTANTIISSYPEWMVRSQDLNPQNAPLVSVKNGTRFTFNALKYDFALEQAAGSEKALSQDDVKEFTAQASSVASIVHEELELSSFVRIGFRVWYLFAGQTKEECEDWIKNLGAFQIADSIMSSFGGPIQSQNHVVVLQGMDRNFRIAVNGVQSQQQLDLGSETLTIQPHKLPKGQREMLLKQERLRQRVLSNPQFAAMIDVDAFVESPLEAIASDFIGESFKQIESGLTKALATR